MVELTTESYVRGCTRLYGRYTSKYRRVLRSSSGSKKKFSGRFTASVPKRHAHHRRFDSRTLLDRLLDRARKAETWTRAQTHFFRGHDSAIWRWSSKSANSAIRYYVRIHPPHTHLFVIQSKKCKGRPGNEANVHYLAIDVGS